MKYSPKQREALKIIAEGTFYPTFVRENDGWHARWHAVSVDNDWVDEFVRRSVMSRMTEDAEEQKHETLHDAWMMALKSRNGLVVWDELECKEFAKELEQWSGAADEDVKIRKGIVFQFVAPNTIMVAVPKGRRGMKALGLAAYVWGPLRGMKKSSDGLVSLKLTHGEAEDFLLHGVRDLQNSGYRVEGVEPRAEIMASAEIGEDGDCKNGKKPKLKLVIRIAREIVSIAEIKFLLEQKSSWVFFRNRWIEVDRGILKRALHALEKTSIGKFNPIGFALGIGHIDGLELAEIRSHGWIRGLVNELRAHGEEALNTGSLDKVRIDGFSGKLRDYQLRGVNWMKFMTEHGFGALLADDMGLGKTIQTIAWVLVSRPLNGPVLIVAPLTLISNWKHEFAAFAPDLKVYVHHGDVRESGIAFKRKANAVEVVITSYNLLVRDYSSFASVEWSALVVDEAQIIKNPDTEVFKAVVALTPVKRIALTGTPIENSVTDVWAIEEFLNPGFLGDRKDFEERFVKPIVFNPQSTAIKRLQHALEPFILRRVKTDKRITLEIGEKRETREYCELMPNQRREYEAALTDFRMRERKQGEIFALLTELKLICDGEGKLLRLVDLLSGIFENGESALVFTQYAKVGIWLKRELEKHFSRKIMLLHGGLNAKEREREIQEFRAARHPTAFVLSLKAGGFGLNLTKATHVIHFDRWWNPAVENQATDRVHRIGQSKTVWVHLFITSGTIEERIENILTRKSRVAGKIVSEAEWLSLALAETEGKEEL